MITAKVNFMDFEHSHEKFVLFHEIKFVVNQSVCKTIPNSRHAPLEPFFKSQALFPSKGKRVYQAKSCGLPSWPSWTTESTAAVVWFSKHQTLNGMVWPFDLTDFLHFLKPIKSQFGGIPISGVFSSGVSSFMTLQMSFNFSIVEFSFFIWVFINWAVLHFLICDPFLWGYSVPMSKQ